MRNLRNGRNYLQESTSLAMILILAMACVMLSSCAVAALVPIVETCADIECAEDEYCSMSWDYGPICFLTREEYGCTTECPDGTECRGSTCFEPNPNGEVCEFDEGVCEPNQFCILGRCTYASCLPGETIPCYSGTQGTEGIGECSAGYHLCTADFVYTHECIGEVVPVEDIGFLGCNGLDDDCDGIADDDRIDKVDIILAIDTSASMGEENLAVSMAMYQASTMYNHPDIRLSLIVFPSPGTDFSETPYPQVAIPLVEYSDFAAQIAFYSLGSSSLSAKESSLDVPWLIAHGELALDQRPGAKTVVIMFTDEIGQSYLDPKVDEEEMCQAIDDADLDLYVLTPPDEVYYSSEASDFRPISETLDDCATNIDLTTDVASMINSLRHIADMVCE